MRKYHKLRRRKRQYTVGDLNTSIILKGRSITAPEEGVGGFTETFTDNATVWAAVDTVRGKSFFDGVGQERPITHQIGIRFDSTVTEETFIELPDGRLLDVLTHEALDSRDEFMVLLCSERGHKDLGATHA